jgi:sulfide:quinone oxidoreductase
MEKKYDLIIVGGGTGGIMIAAQMRKLKPQISIALIEPSEVHWYQPAWTLVGAGTYDFEKTKRPMKDQIPAGVEWMKDWATAINPDTKTISLKGGNTLHYSYLVLSPGLIYKNELVPGLQEALDKGTAISIYTDPKKAWDKINNFTGGTALFTQPTTPIKCGGAPQKIMYLAESHFRKSSVRDKTKVVFATGGGVIFGVQPIKETLMKVNARKGINLRFGHNLVKIDADNNIAWYKLGDNQSEFQPSGIEIQEKDGLVGIPFDLLHTAPPSVVPEFLQNSGLLNEGGWIEVDIHSMQHKKYPEIFGIGDAAALPTAKTGAAIRKQIPVVVDNLQKLMDGKTADNKDYNGYSSCPLVTDYGKMVLAEFDYQNNFTPDPKLKQLLVFNSDNEHWRLWMLKKYGLPYLYWNKMMKGVVV